MSPYRCACPPPPEPCSWWRTIPGIQVAVAIALFVPATAVFVMATSACTKEQLNRLDPPASLSGDGGWTPDEDDPGCPSPLGCGSGVGRKRDAGKDAR